MLELKKSLNGLSNMSFAFEDKTLRAENTFHLYDFPETFYLGKNSFKIFIDKENLVEGSQIFIDIIDPRGNSLYYKVSNQISPDKTRTIIVHVYDTTPIGECQVLIAGRLKRIPKTGQEIPFSHEPTSINYKNIPNVIWRGKTNISLTENVTDIIFDELPKVTFTEKRIPVQSISSTGSRLVEQYPSSSVLINFNSINSPRQIEDKGNLNTERTQDGNIVTEITQNSGSITFAPRQERIPTNFDYLTVRTNYGFFSSSMEGGKIEINNISYERPNNSNSVFVSQSYTGSIVRVISPTLANIYPGFNHNIDYIDQNGISQKLIIDKILNHSNFTASFYQPRTVTENTTSYLSYLQLRIENVEPEQGSIKYLQTSYKELNSTGQLIDLGQYPVPEFQNILVLPNVYRQYSNLEGLQEKELGRFETISDFSNYWSGSTNNDETFLLDRIATNISNGILPLFSIFSNSTKYAELRLASSSFYIQVYKDTEYKIEFDSYFGYEYLAPTIPAQVDVYVSGTALIESSVQNKNFRQNPIENYQFGQFVGSVDGQFAKRQHPVFYFKATKSGLITPVFVYRSIPTEIGNIKISYRNEKGYSPNTIETLIRVPDLEQSAEVVVNIEYLNSKKHPSDYVSKIYGITFQGNTTSSIRLPDGIVSSSNQLTSSFDLRYETRGRNIVSASQQILNFGFLSTASYQIDSSSWNSTLQNINFKTSSFATTSSNQFSGNQIITGSLTVSGSDVRVFGNVSASQFSGSFFGNGSGLTGILTASFASSSIYSNLIGIPSGILSSSNQTDYNLLQNKINLSGSNQRFLVKTGVSSSIAYESLQYSVNRSGSAPDRTRFIGIEQEHSITSSIGNHSEIIMISQSNGIGSSISPFVISSLFPAFTLNENNNQGTGSLQVMAIGYTVESVFLGFTGSISNPFNRYVWASTVQGRLMLTSADNSGQPYSFTAVAMSSSTYNQIGTFGNAGGPAGNLDSWYSVIGADVSGNKLRIRHQIQPTSSFNWTIYGQSICRLNKFEYTF